MHILRPAYAAGAGALWGATFYTLCDHDASLTGIPPTSLLAGLILIPAAYAGLGAWQARRIGFNPALLALGWMLVELALRPLGFHQGLLAASQSDSPALHWMAHLLGYVFVAFFVACVNASLLLVLNRIRIPVFSPGVAMGVAPARTRQRLSSRMLARSLHLVHAQSRAPPLAAGA